MPEILENEKKLLEDMGFIPSSKDPKLYETEIENGKAFIDYRRENGRRYASINGAMAKGDAVPILQKFKEEKDKLQSSKIDDLETKESSIGEGSNSKESSTPTIPPQPPANKTFLDELVNAYEIEIAEIFGNAGDGKSTVVAKFALDALAQGKKVLFVDTESGFTKRTREKLGNSYQYISNIRGLMDFCRNIPKDVDLLIIDSVGYPVLTEWAKLGVNEKGNSLTQIIAIKDMIKDWAINNNRVAIVTNQPDSDFGKDKDYVNRPFGDKGQFVIKEVFKIVRKESSPTRTKSILEIFRSRYDARGVKVADIEITNDGVTIK